MNQIQKEAFTILCQFDELCKKHDIKYMLYSGTLLGAIRHHGFIPWDDDIDVIMKRSEYEKFEKIFNHQFGLELQTPFHLPFYYHAHSKLRNYRLDVFEDVAKTQVNQRGPWIDIFINDHIPDDLAERQAYFKAVRQKDELLRKCLMIQANPIDHKLKYWVKKVIQTFNETFYRFYFFVPRLVKDRHERLIAYNHVDTEMSAIASFYTDYNDFETTFIRNACFENLILKDFEGVLFPIPADYDECLTQMYGDYMTPVKESERVGHRIIAETENK